MPFDALLQSGSMTVDDLRARFPEIPADLRDEPVLARFAATFGSLLAVAHKPGNCSTAYDAGNYYYLQLVGPISYYGYGLASRQRVVQDLEALLDRHAADSDGFADSLLPAGAAMAEVKGPGCA